MILLSLLPKLLEGLLLSVLITVMVLAIAYPIGLGLSMLHTARSRFIRGLVFVVVEFARGAPVLVLLYLVYFGLPSVGIVLAPIPSAVIAFTISTAAYSSEIFRGAFSSLPRGQHAAAQVLGFSAWQRLTSILLPQALRIATPSLVAFAIIVFQGTALAYAISVPELLGRAYNEASISFRYLEVLSIAALIYLGFSLAGTWGSSRLEQRMARAFART